MYQQIQALYDMFDKLNKLKFNSILEKPIITIQAQNQEKTMF